MIKYLRIMLDYKTYPIWLYGEDGLAIDTDNPPEWADDTELTDAFMVVSNLYDTFFINTKYKFSYIGCPDEETRLKLIELFNHAMDLLIKKNNGKYPIKVDVSFDDLYAAPES